MDNQLEVIETPNEKYKREMAEQAYEIFIDQIDNNLTITQLAEKYQLSPKTINTRLKLARKTFYKELEEQGATHASDIWKKYEWGERELKREWEINRDPAIFNQLRAIWKDMRDMMKLDKAPKSAVNEQGKAVPNTLVMVFNDDGYKKLEEKYNYKPSDLNPIVSNESDDIIITKENEE